MNEKIKWQYGHVWKHKRKTKTKKEKKKKKKKEIGNVTMMY